MDAVITLQLMARICAVLAIIQAYEFLCLTPVTSDRGVWRWDDLKNEIAGKSGFLRGIFGCFLKSGNFRYFNIFRIMVAITVLLMPTPEAMALLLIIHILTLVRWLGSFNGGSDYMTSILLLFVSLGLFFPESMAAVALWYIAFQSTLSYFKAGFYKLKAQNWRSGTAAREFIISPIYERSQLLETLMKSPVFSRLSSWGIIFFEITFPVCLFHQNLAALYLAAGFLFHLLNAYVFGLNRFVFAWIATYPALYYCSFRS
ncbi:MAG: HTTM domain-containing protein [Bdellovibrionota bacterium]